MKQKELWEGIPTTDFFYDILCHVITNTPYLDVSKSLKKFKTLFFCTKPLSHYILFYSLDVISFLEIKYIYNKKTSI